jgi:hypothetical protein
MSYLAAMVDGKYPADTQLHDLTAKTPLVNNDEMFVLDSEDDNSAKKVLWSAIKATLKTYFDGLYAKTTASEYTALVTQASTSAPTASEKSNGFGATTFTWARSSAGVYTCTASTAVFTANKTSVLLGAKQLPSTQIGVAITSTTVITVTVTVADGATATDALLTNQEVTIRVYP